MHPLAQKIHARTRLQWSKTLNDLAELRQYVDRCSVQGELADAAFALRKAKEMADDIRREVGKLEDRAIMLGCMLWVRDPAMKENIKTEYVTATPSVVEMPKLPSRKESPNEYFRLLHSIGVPEHLHGTESESSVVTPNWPGIIELITKRGAQGLPVPEGLDLSKTYTQCKMVMRAGKKPIEDTSTDTVNWPADEPTAAFAVDKSLTAMPVADSKVQVKNPLEKRLSQWLRNSSQKEVPHNQTSERSGAAQQTAEPPQSTVDNLPLSQLGQRIKAQAEAMRNKVAQFKAAQQADNNSLPPW